MRPGSVPSLDVLEAAMELRALRHEALASNIANVDTPGYARLDVRFKGRLEEALARRERGLVRTHPRHLAGSGADPRPEIVAERSVMRVDGNGVDIDRELAELARNTLEYSVLSRLAGDTLARLRLVATEGRR